MRIADILISGVFIALCSIYFMIRIFIAKVGSKEYHDKKVLLVIQNYHTYESIKMSGHEEIITQTDLGGYFEKVITLYPTVGSDSGQPMGDFRGRSRSIRLNDIHLFLEYKMNAFKSNRFSILPFILSQFQMLNEVISLSKANNVSVVRGYCPFLTGLYAIIVGKCCGVPITLRVGANYDLMYENSGLMVYKKIFKNYKVAKKVANFVFRNSDCVSAVNLNNKEYCVANGANPDKTHVVRYGNMIDPQHYIPPNERGLLDADCVDLNNRPVAICVGRLTKIKHPEDVLLATRVAKCSIPNLLTVIVGTGDMELELVELSKDLEIQDNILFMGKRDQDFLARLYPHANVYLSPLTGRTMVEAALAGLPLIAYDYEWQKEIAKDAITGLLVPFRDYEKMGQAMISLLTDPDYASKLGSNARENTLDLMDKLAIKEKEVGLYNSLISLRA
jgi:glycosyltransferase involved in cell wall biosynthesis